MKEATTDLLLHVFGQLFRAFFVGLYAAIGVVAALGYEAAVHESGRVLFGASIAFGLRSMEMLVPRPKETS